MYQPRSDSTADSGPDVDMFCQLARIPREELGSQSPILVQWKPTGFLAGLF